MGHAVAEQGERDEPEEEKEDIQDNGKFGGEPAAAVDDGCEEDIEEGEDSGDKELMILLVLISILNSIRLGSRDLGIS